MITAIGAKPIKVLTPIVVQAKAKIVENAGIIKTSLFEKTFVNLPAKLWNIPVSIIILKAPPTIITKKTISEAFAKPFIIYTGICKKLIGLFSMYLKVPGIIIDCLLTSSFTLSNSPDGIIQVKRTATIIINIMITYVFGKTNFFFINTHLPKNVF